MDRKTETRILASGAPAVSSRPASPLPPPATPAVAPSAAPPARPRRTPSAESEWAQGRVAEPILRTTRGADGQLVTEFLPPTLYNLTHLKEGDQVSQSNRHFRTLDPVDDILRRKLERTPGAGVFSDLQITWPDPAMARSSPDVFVVFGLERPPEELGDSFNVAKEGVGPCLIFEIVSGTYKDTREKDYDFNPVHYAKAGVRELVLVEPVTEGSPEIDILVAYRLDDAGTYEEIEPDAEGRILLETVGFHIHVEQAAVVLEDAQTGERFLTSQQEEDGRKAAERRAQQEARDRKAAQRRAEEEARDRKAAQRRAEEAQRRAAKSRAEALLTVLGARGFALSGEDRGRILATAEEETLDRWLRQAATASSLEETLDESS